MTVNDRHRLAGIRDSKELNDWRTANESQVLIINSHDEVEHAESAASAFSIHYLDVLQKQKAGIVLNWVCGPNVRPRDIAQCLLQQLFERGTLKTKGTIDEKTTLNTLMEALKMRIRAELQNNPVFCFLDCFSICEASHSQEETWQLLVGLISILNTRPEHQPFRMIVSSATYCRTDLRGIRGVEFLEVPGSPRQ